MPTIDVAMRRSVQEGLVERFVDLLARSIHPALQRRNVADDLNDVKTAFSSWDNCMQVDYCKYVHPPSVLPAARRSNSANILLTDGPPSDS